MYLKDARSDLLWGGNWAVTDVTKKAAHSLSGKAPKLPALGCEQTVACYVSSYRQHGILLPLFLKYKCMQGAGANQSIRARRSAVDGKVCKGFARSSMISVSKPSLGELQADR